MLRFSILAALLATASAVPSHLASGRDHAAEIVGDGLKTPPGGFARNGNRNANVLLAANDAPGGASNTDASLDSSTGEAPEPNSLKKVQFSQHWNMAADGSTVATSTPDSDPGTAMYDAKKSATMVKAAATLASRVPKHLDAADNGGIPAVAPPNSAEPAGKKSAALGAKNGKRPKLNLDQLSKLLEDAKTAQKLHGFPEDDNITKTILAAALDDWGAQGAQATLFGGGGTPDTTAPARQHQHQHHPASRSNHGSDNSDVALWGHTHIPVARAVGGVVGGAAGALTSAGGALTSAGGTAISWTGDRIVEAGTTAVSLANQATNVIDEEAGRLAKVTVQTVNIAGKATGHAFNTVKNGIVEAANTLKQMSEDALNALKMLIAAFFMNFPCQLTFSDFTSAFTGALGFDTMKNIMKMFDPDTWKSFGTASLHIVKSTCELVWNILGAQNPILDFATRLLAKCNGGNKGGAKVPAVSFGLAGSVAATAGYEVAGGAEIGVAIDTQGERTCYIGGCITEGFALPPDAGGSASVAFALTFWFPDDEYDGMTNIPGGMNIMALGAAGNIGLPGASLELGGGVNIFYSPDLGSIKGLGVEIELGGTASAPDPTDIAGAEISFGVGQCFTPLCISTEGRPCGSKQAYGWGNGFPWSQSDVGSVTTYSNGWYTGEAGESCSTACSKKGKSCNLQTTKTGIASGPETDFGAKCKMEWDWSPYGSSKSWSTKNSGGHHWCEVESHDYSKCSSSWMWNGRCWGWLKSDSVIMKAAEANAVCSKAEGWSYDVSPAIFWADAQGWWVPKACVWGGSKSTCSSAAWWAKRLCYCS